MSVTTLTNETLALRAIMIDELHKAHFLSLLDRPREAREFIDKRNPSHGLDRVHGAVAPTAFHKARHFDINGSAPDLAVILPFFNEFQEVEDLVALELGGERRVRTFLGRATCIGLRELFEARHHPNHRVLVSSSLWPWLRNGCEGVLPVNWRWFHLCLQARRIGVICSSVQEGDCIEELLQQALPKVPVFVRGSEGTAGIAA